jgi:protein arginine kinase activator
LAGRDVGYFSVKVRLEGWVFAEEPPGWSFELGSSVTCERCGEEPAAVHLLRVSDGAVTHTHLCADCAEGVAEETEGLALVLAVPSALRHLAKSPAAEAEAPPVSETKRMDHLCGFCGTTLTDLKESGVVGCSKCYEAFADYLGTLLADGADSVEHLGKIPHRGPEHDSLRHEMLRLQRMLRELVACERFEEAAGVRDRLTELGARLEGGAE